MIRNFSKKTIIARNYKICKSALSKAIGLMFRRKPRSLVMVFDKEEIVPLHMMFVFFSIDVLFLDKNKKVIELKENFKPFTLLKPIHRCNYIVELPAGKIKKSKTDIGDVLTFKI